LLIWGGAAIGATLVNPYLLRAWLFPIELMRRIDGSNGAYLAIGEFRPPFSGYFPTFALGSYQVMIFALLALAAIAGMARRRRPARHVGRRLRRRGAVRRRARLPFAAGRSRGCRFWRDATSASSPSASCLSWARPWASCSHGGREVSSNARTRRGISRSRVRLRSRAQAATNGWYARTGETHEFGLGVFKSNFQTRATQFFREQKLPGPTYNDMTTGGYLTWDDPSGKGVYIDGRLEVYDTPFFPGPT
jgi:hypothetical protein